MVATGGTNALFASILSKSIRNSRSRELGGLLLLLWLFLLLLLLGLWDLVSA